ncbi:MAG: 1-acyl-sn-glycerol-3-phosphate acyltransferase [Solirubrobacteraceae bacterium]|jgi:1-acyl-sn-glycerol-3-phosphate acyltransferase
MSGPLLAPAGPRRQRWLRITRGILGEFVLFVVLTALAPLLLLAACGVDFTLWLRRRKPWMAVRLLVLMWMCLFGELRGLVGVLRVWLLSGGPWSSDSPRRRQRTYRLQVAWASGHLAAVCRLCGVSFEVEGAELVGRGPLIIFARHASIVDNGLPARLISGAHGFDLRYVLKHELQMLPTLDLGARWVPTCFVERASNDPEREIARVASLAIGLDGERDGVLIFPEGTRYTAAKLAALKARSDIADPRLRASIERLQHTLPPRTGGPLALLAQAPQAAVLVCGHVGLDDFRDLREIWSGALIGTTVRVRFRRYERAELPQLREDLRTWLYECWQELDDWVAAQHAARAAGVAA